METLYTLSYNAVTSHLKTSIRYFIPKQWKAINKAETSELIKCLFPNYSYERPFTLPVKFSNAFFKSILKSNYLIDVNELVSFLISSNIFRLTELDVSKSEITNESIEKAKSNNIVSLDISNCRRVMLSQLENGDTNRWWVDTLEELRMRNLITPQRITLISLYPHLRSLDISGTTLAIGKGNNNLMRGLLRELINLEEIDISETNIPLKWLAEFKHAPKLKKITARFKIENENIQPLCYFEPPNSLTHLDISCNIHSPTGYNEKLYDSRLTTKSANTIQKLLSLPNLKYLDVSFCGISKENINIFMKQKVQLDFLGLFGNDAASNSSKLTAKTVTGHITTIQLITSIKYYKHRPDYMKIILQRLLMNEKKFLIRMQTSEYIEAITGILEDGITSETSHKILNMFLEHCQHSLVLSSMDIELIAKDLYILLVKVLHSIREQKPSWNDKTMRGVLPILKQLREKESSRVYEQDIITTTRLRTILLKYLDNINLSPADRDAAITQEIYSILSHINIVVENNTFVMRTKDAEFNEFVSIEIKE